VTSAEVPLRTLRFLLVSIITPRLHTGISFIYHRQCGDTRWRTWLRHYTTSRKVAGSIRGGVIGIFHWHNTSDSADNGNEYQEYFLGGKDGRCLGLTTLLFPSADCFEIGSRNHVKTSGPLQGQLYLYLLPPNATY
jgi:hypothetical protein